ncbi:MAG TPA: calcium-binding protein [Tepidisphaeraceae bacterium]|nr:calcium-binding protein [Tepidisphaeraceae bacterium]
MGRKQSGRRSSIQRHLSDQMRQRIRRQACLPAIDQLESRQLLATISVNSSMSTSAIQTAITNAAADDVVEFASGTYNLTDGLLLTSGTAGHPITYQLESSPSGPAILVEPNAEASFQLTNDTQFLNISGLTFSGRGIWGLAPDGLTDVNIDGCTFTGAVAAGDHDHAIEMGSASGVNNTTITNNNFIDFGGDTGLWLDSPNAVTITGNNFRNVGEGIHIDTHDYDSLNSTWGSDILFDSNNFVGIARVGIEVQGDRSIDLTVSNNKFSSFRNYGEGSLYALSIVTNGETHTSGTEIFGNEISDIGNWRDGTRVGVVYGIEVAGHGSQVHDNKIFGTHVPIFAETNSDIAIYDNQIVQWYDFENNIDAKGIQSNNAANLDESAQSDSTEDITTLTGQSWQVAFDRIITGTSSADTFSIATVSSAGVVNYGLNSDSIPEGPLSYQGRAIIYGLDGNDSITFSNTSDTYDLIAVGGNDNDTLSGGAGNDSLLGQAGTDVLSGNDGNDFLAGGSGQDTLTGGNGTDTLDFSSISSAVTVNLGSGTAGPSAELDTISGFENAYGGSGNDSLVGTSGANMLDGGDGDDTVNGGLGDDSLIGEDGNDSLLGSSGNDFLDGQSGNDTLSGDDDSDTLSGGDDTDSLLGGNGTDSLLGDNGADYLDGQAGNDTLNGEDGNDTLYAGTSSDGADVLIGGNDSDRADYTGRTAALTITLDGTANDGASGETDNVNADIESLWGGSGNDTFSAVSVSYAIELRGGSGNDTLTGGSGNDTLNGQDGTDSILGGNGTDSLLGGNDADYLDGQSGNDTMNGEDGNDTLYAGTSADGADVMSGGNGSDRADYTARTAALTITLDGSANDGASGETDNVNSDIESLWGGAGDDSFSASGVSTGVQLKGVGGNDTLVGGNGNDSLYGDAVGVGTGNDSIIGGGGNDSLFGDGGNDYLDGQSGIDTMNGEDGNDTLYAGTSSDGADIMNGGNGNDRADYTARTAALTITLDGSANDGAAGETDNVNADIESLWGGTGDDSFSAASVSTTVQLKGGAGNDTLIGGSGNDSLYGDPVGAGTGNDSILGGGGNDSLFGDGGNDYLDGQLGNDTMNGEDGNDTLYAGASSDGADVMNGGNGSDRADYTARTAALTITLDGSANDGAASETDNVNADIESLWGGSGNDTFSAASVSTTVQLKGGAGNDTLTGGSGNDSLYGDPIGSGTGNDSLLGGGGNDTLYGDGGDDTLTGGSGDDVLNGEAGNDHFFAGGDGGHDTLDGGSGTDTKNSWDSTLDTLISIEV